MRNFFFISPMWSFDSPVYRQKVLDGVNSAARNFPQHSYTMLLNDPLDFDIREELDKSVGMFVCGEHSLVDTDLFRVAPQQCEYDAVYIAANHPYKRIGLAWRIKRLCLIAKNISPDDFARIELPHSSVTCPNVEGGIYRALSPAEVSSFLARSGCGLILSHYEGQNRATIEYLLGGLPVVTTPSRGGRDRYLTPANSIVTEAKSEAIAEAVTYAASAGFDRISIAGAARAAVQAERARLSDIIDKVLDRHEVAPIGLYSKAIPHNAFSRPNSLAHYFRERL